MVDGNYGYKKWMKSENEMWNSVIFQNSEKVYEWMEYELWFCTTQPRNLYLWSGSKWFEKMTSNHVILSLSDIKH